MTLTVTPADPAAADVRVLLDSHLAFCRATTPIENAHALEPAALADPGVTLFAARRGGVLLGVGAIKRIDDGHAELKSMHTVAAERGQGVGGAVLDAMLATARERGFAHVSLETGTSEHFAAARALYERAGFVPCGPFGGYRATPDNTYLTLPLR